MAIERSIRINVEAGRAKAELRSLQGSLRDTDRAAGAAATASRALGAAIAGVVSIQTARSILNTADSYTNLQNKIRTVIDETQSLSNVTNKLFEISNRALTPIEATTNLYQRLALNTKSLGASQEDLFRVIETVAKAGAIANDGIDSLGASLTQLGQAFGGDFKANAEELNSILSQTPALAKAIADGLGVASSDLKSLGEQGVLSSELVFNALLKISDSVDKNFSQAVVNVSASFGILQNAVTKYIGEVDQANGVTASISNTIRDVAENFEAIADTIAGVAVPAFTALAAVIAGRLAGAIAASTKAAASNIAVTLAQNKAIVQNAAFEADRAAAIQLTTFATLNKVKAEEASTIVALNNIKAVQAQLIAERELEVVRLKAQITDIGRTQSLARLAEIRLAEAATTAQVTAAETALSAAKSKTTLAYNTFTAASAAATAATTAHARALKASTLAANAGAAATGAFRSALALIGGPAGAALIASFAVFKLAQATDSYRKEAERTERATDDLAESFKKLGREQLNQARAEAVANLAKLSQEQESLSVATKEASGAIARENTILGGLGGQLAKSAQNYNKNTEARIKNNAQVAAAEAALKALNNELGINSDATDENAKNADLVASAYKKLKGELDSATKIQLDYEESVAKINKQLPEGEKRTELLRLAEKKRDADLARLNERTRKAEERNAKLHRSYVDLRGEFDPLAKISFEYQEILKEIDQSTASVSEKETLRALAAKQLRENLDDAIVTGQEFLAQFDSIAAAEVRRIDLLKQLEKVQASASEKQALAAEIQRQYNKEIDDAIPSFTELNAQFSAADAATVAYVDTLKQLDEAQRLGVDVTELRVNALKAYKKAAEEARKQDILNTETSQSFFGALLQGLNDSVQTADSSFDQIREVGRGAIDDLSVAITDFVATGEFNFRSFAANVINELLRIQTQALLLEGMDFFKNLGGDSEDGGFLQAAGSAVGGLFGGGEEETSATEPLNLGSFFGGESFGGEDQSAMFRDNWLSSIGEVGTAFDETFQNAIAQSDAFGSSTESAAASIGTSLVSSLIKMGTQLLTNATIGQTAQATIAATGATTASTLAAAWAPAAAATSLASFGANAVPATAGITSTYALTQTLSSAGALTGGKFARGGVMDIGEFSNQIVSTPTKFAAGGTVNQMGEAGAEAILPLQRTAGGELGVNASGMAVPTQPNVNVDVPVQVINVTERPQDYLTSDAGVRQIINIVNQNRDAIA